MSFFTFHQNNSGGFHTGPAINVIIEAASAAEAVTKAEDVGLYFNGCHAGNDCPCCGDRWHAPYSDEGTSAPEIYGQSPEEYIAKESSWLWGEREGVTEVFIVNADGTKRELLPAKKSA